MGLVLSRRVGQAITLEVPGWPTLTVRVTETHRSSCKLKVDAPGGVVVARAELHEPLPPLALEEDRSLEQQKADGDCPNPYAVRDESEPPSERRRERETRLLACMLRGSQMLWPKDDDGKRTWETLSDATRSQWLEVAERVIFLVNHVQRWP